MSCLADHLDHLIQYLQPICHDLSSMSRGKKECAQPIYKWKQIDCISRGLLHFLLLAKNVQLRAHNQHTDTDFWQLETLDTFLHPYKLHYLVTVLNSEKCQFQMRLSYPEQLQPNSIPPTMRVYWNEFYKSFKELLVIHIPHNQC